MRVPATNSTSFNSNFDIADDPIFQASLASEPEALTDNLSNFKGYPVISLAFIYNF